MSQDTFEDEFEICPITNETLDAAISVMTNSYFRDECISKAVKLCQNSEAIKEIGTLLKLIAEDGLSIIAISKKESNVVGVEFNKLEVKSEGKPTFYEDYMRKCNNPSSKEWIKVRNDITLSQDVFEICNTNCYITGVAIAVLPEYRGKGVANKLMEAFIEVPRCLMNGKNIKLSLDSKLMSIEPVPRAIATVATAAGSQYMLSKYGFKTATAIKKSSLVFEGVSFDKIGEEAEYIKLMYYVL